MLNCLGNANFISSLLSVLKRGGKTDPYGSKKEAQRIKARRWTGSKACQVSANLGKCLMQIDRFYFVPVQLLAVVFSVSFYCRTDHFMISYKVGAIYFLPF